MVERSQPLHSEVATLTPSDSKLDEFMVIENIVNEKLASVSVTPVQTILWMKNLKKDQLCNFLLEMHGVWHQSKDALEQLLEVKLLFDFPSETDTGETPIGDTPNGEDELPRYSSEQLNKEIMIEILESLIIEKLST